MAEQRSILQRLFGGGTQPTTEKATPSFAPDTYPYARGAQSINTIAKMSTEQLRRWSRNNPWIRAAVKSTNGSEVARTVPPTKPEGGFLAIIY